MDMIAAEQVEISDFFGAISYRVAPDSGSLIQVKKNHCVSHEIEDTQWRIRQCLPAQSSIGYEFFFPSSEG